MYNAKTIAKWFINELHPEPLKLQKLLYFSQGFSFAFNDKQLFDDDMEAWVHGPVVPLVYHTYKEYVYNPIDISYEIETFDEETLEVLEYVKEKYARYDAKFLEDLTHNQEPWLISRAGLDPDESSDKTIAKQNIANYFISLVHQPSEEDWC